jgi:amidohydrolase
MAIVSGLAQRFFKRRPDKGTVALLYQPAEETGQGARRVLDDEKFQQLNPDYVLAFHNLPGFELGSIVVRKGVFASTSVGVKIKLIGKTSHAGEPEQGVSPALAVAQLIQGLSSIAQFHTSLHEPAQATVIYARVGEVAFGTSPGEGEVMVTLRADSHDVIDSLTAKVAEFATRTANVFGLGVTVDLVEPFPVTINDPEVIDHIEESARKANLGVHRLEFPFAWSEDFGHFTKAYKGALFGIGAGISQPALHHPDYDFPDKLIEPAINMLELLIRQLLDGDHV